ncbi:MAG: hypothetical protein ABI652_07530 [Acidobacteriota bacterium]
MARAHALTTPGPPRVRRPRVVVIEDQAGQTERLCRVLGDEGVDSHVVAFREFLIPRAALALLLGPHVDAILLDVPEGDEAADWRRVCVVRRLTRLWSVPLVITTRSPSRLADAVGSTTVIEVVAGTGPETIAIAIARFVGAVSSGLAGGGPTPERV